MSGLFLDYRDSSFLDPVIQALDIACVHSLLDGSTEICPVLIYTGHGFLLDFKVLSDSCNGLSFYACRTKCMASMKESHLAEVEWYQLFCWDPFLFQKVLSAAKTVASFTFSHCSVEARMLSPTKVEEISALNLAK